ncbi:hypothetical protein H5410_008980 [Solanum commersonii]|uniref:Uncharacterized protein n=1 Tax=Solanum commersonii TaxID=4109 RepID=A0A9J6AI75_SOLCO|nr:hypothetical protein H5410_008980 [Solanum commersonii]
MVVSAQPTTFLQDFKVTWSDSHVKQIDATQLVRISTFSCLNSCYVDLLPKANTCLDVLA